MRVAFQYQYEDGVEADRQSNGAGGGFGFSRVGWIAVVLGIGVIVFFVLSNPGMRRSGSGSWDTRQWLAPLLIVTALLGHRFVSWRRPRRQWEASEQARSLYVVEADADRISFDSGTSRHEHRWHAFTHVSQTTHLFLVHLRDDPSRVLIIPKRAFADDVQRGAFWDLCSQSIKASASPAFPVLPPPRPPGVR
jgi:hypothetical protein